MVTVATERGGRARAAKGRTHSGRTHSGRTIGDCGNVMNRDRNAAVNHYWYGEEPRNRVPLDATRVETGDQVGGESHLPVPVVETRMLAGIGL